MTDALFFASFYCVIKFQPQTYPSIFTFKLLGENPTNYSSQASLLASLWLYSVT